MVGGGLNVAEIARRAALSRPAVWRWQRRFAEAGVDGLLRDQTRKPGRAPLPEALQPHRIRTFKRSRDPDFAAKLAAGLWGPRTPQLAAGLWEPRTPQGAAHKHDKVRQWLARHPRWVLHFTPTSGSWLNAALTFFSALTRRRLKRGVFRSIVDLQAAINRYLDDHDAQPKPFIWTRSASMIIDKLNQATASLLWVVWTISEKFLYFN